MIYEVIKKFLKLSASTEKAALEIYERLPLSLRYRALYGPVFLRWLKVLKEAEGWDQERLYAFSSSRQGIFSCMQWPMSLTIKIYSGDMDISLKRCRALMISGPSVS